MPRTKPESRFEIRHAALQDGRVVVQWGDGHRSRFHPLWLSHCGAARSALAPPPGEGRFRRATPDAKSIGIAAEGGLAVAWSPSDKETVFPADWLRRHCPDPEARTARRRQPRLWDGAVAAELPGMAFSEAIQDDAARLQLFGKVLTWGFARLEGVPIDETKVVEVAELFGLPRLSPYGNPEGDPKGLPRAEDIKRDDEVQVATHMAQFLGPHTDTCWRSSLSGLIFLHCLAAEAEGGETLLVDGFAVAAALREASPEAFELLARTPVDFASSVNNGDEWRARGRIINLDEEGRIDGIRYNENSIQAPDPPESLLCPLFEALARFEEQLYDQRRWFKLRLRPGDLLVIDNHRVLHGRTAFAPKSGRRHLRTTAVERDLFLNNYRRLARAAGDSDWDADFPRGAT